MSDPIKARMSLSFLYQLGRGLPALLIIVTSNALAQSRMMIPLQTQDRPFSETMPFDIEQAEREAARIRAQASQQRPGQNPNRFSGQQNRSQTTSNVEEVNQERVVDEKRFGNHDVTALARLAESARNEHSLASALLVTGKSSAPRDQEPLLNFPSLSEIDDQGNPVIPPDFDQAALFSDLEAIQVEGGVEKRAIFNQSPVKSIPQISLDQHFEQFQNRPGFRFPTPVPATSQSAR